MPMPSVSGRLITGANARRRRTGGSPLTASLLKTGGSARKSLNASGTERQRRAGLRGAPAGARKCQRGCRIAEDGYRRAEDGQRHGARGELGVISSFVRGAAL